MSVPVSKIYGQELIDAILLHDKTAFEKMTDDKSKVNVNFVDEKGQTPLCYAIQEEQYALAERLLRMGANPNYNGKPFDESRTPLQAAIEVGQIDFVELLLKWKAKANLPCNYPYSHLLYAASKGHLAIVKLLVKAGADKHFKNKHENTALDLALENGHLSTIAYLQQQGCKRSKNLSNAPEEYYLSVLKLADWLSKNPDWSNTDLTNVLAEVNKMFINTVSREYFSFLNDNYSFMLLALKCGHWRIADLLYKLKVPLPSYSDFLGMHGNIQSTLHFIAFYGYTDAANWFLSLPECQGIDLDELNDERGFGATPLGWAASGNHTGMMNLLIDRGASVNVMNAHGGTPLIRAYRHSTSNYFAAQLLLDRGCNPDHPSKEAFEEEFKTQAEVIKVNEQYKIAASFLTPRIIKLLASMIDVEYFQKTNNVLRNKAVKLLDRLIERAAKHAVPLILDKNKAAITAQILSRINTIYVTAATLQNALEKEIDTIKNIFESSLINKLRLMLVRPPAYAMQAQFAYELQALGFGTKNKAPEEAMRSSDFYGLTNSFLTQEYSGLHSFSPGPESAPKSQSKTHAKKPIVPEARLSDFECSLLQFMPARKEAETKGVVEVKVGVEVKTSSETATLSLESEETVGDEPKVKNEKFEAIRKDFFAILQEIHQRRAEIAKSIMQKFRIARENARNGAPFAAGREESKSGKELIRFSGEKKTDTLVAGTGKVINISPTAAPGLSSPTSVQVLSTPPSPISEMDKLVARFFTLAATKSAEDDKELLEARDLIFSASGQETMQRVTRLLLEKLELAPIDPKPLLLSMLKSPTQKSKKATASKSRVVFA